MVFGLTIVGGIADTARMFVYKSKEYLKQLILEGEKAFDSNRCRKNDFSIATH